MERGGLKPQPCGTLELIAHWENELLSMWIRNLLPLRNKVMW